MFSLETEKLPLPRTQGLFNIFIICVNSKIRIIDKLWNLFCGVVSLSLSQELTHIQWFKQKRLRKWQEWEDICHSRRILFDKLFRAICNGVYEGNDTELGRNALQVRAKILQNKYNPPFITFFQARNISTVLSSCKARVESACNFSLPDMTKIDVRLVKPILAVPDW